MRGTAPIARDLHRSPSSPPHTCGRPVVEDATPTGDATTEPEAPVADPNKNNLNAEIYYPAYLFAAGGVRAPRPTITTAPTCAMR